ncbi:hypothetical protein PtA15_10A282 [Puccinia triticina]|uniref:Uncharacterized protein n=1 Tax=Puccinia triticina TaxID=208348 RepID=A0ABY7CUD6_9BASI|nr:uncharacterized protein PtA15_10A282 [Puccinia triticina]WAQ88861.1 hypothetical protein PtA15_10A282 [Puccinia triticina]WAR58919.1 hypothetical protein PtB15_10B259 [Puccinia triticina]
MSKLVLFQAAMLISSALCVPSLPGNSGIQSRSITSVLSERSAPDERQVHTSTAYAFEKTAILVYEVLNRVASHSWEWGAQAQVIFERDYPDYSVYSQTRKLPLSSEDGPLKPPTGLINFLEPILAKRDPKTKPIVDGDGASGDPASLGVPVIVAAATSNKERAKYFQKLADDQLDWLMHHVPTNENGAISQRNKELQYWSDYMYMAPPFLAFYGAQTSNATLLEIAYNQAKQYRTILRNGKIKVWEHIKDGSFEDRNFWSTGNGWAAAGMMRLYSTFLNLRDPKLRELTELWRQDLAKWVAEIVKGAYAYQDKETLLLPNYLANTDPAHNYPECSGTALIAAAAYRLVSLRPTSAKRLPLDAINAARVAIFTKYTNPKTGAVAPVVDPLNWNAPKPFNGEKPIVGYVSPEGQAFTILLFEAWKAYVSTLNCNANSSDHPHCPSDTSAS